MKALIPVPLNAACSFDVVMFDRCSSVPESSIMPLESAHRVSAVHEPPVTPTDVPPTKQLLKRTASQAPAPLRTRSISTRDTLFDSATYAPVNCTPRASEVNELQLHRDPMKDHCDALMPAEDETIEQLPPL